MRRRLATVLAVIALGASALIAAPAATAVPSSPGAAYVAFGDSEAAGTGNLPYVDKTCLRSAKSYPLLLGGVSFACSGANTTDVLTQVGQAAYSGVLGPQTQFVTITVGVNNADWQGVLAACSSAGNEVACGMAFAEAGAALATVPGGLATALGAIRQAAPTAYIAVTGYPLLFGQVTGSCSVGAFQGTPVKFTALQTQQVNAGLGQVNAAVAGGIQAYQALFTQAMGYPDPFVSYVDVTAGFAGHGLCDSGDRWISGLVSGPPVADRSFHANAAGQQALAGIIAGLMP